MSQTPSNSGPTPGPHQARFIFRMIRAAREAPGLLFNSGPEHDWADSELWASASETAAERDRLRAEVDRLRAERDAYLAYAACLQLTGNARGSREWNPRQEVERARRLATFDLARPYDGTFDPITALNLEVCRDAVHAAGDTCRPGDSE